MAYEIEPVLTVGPNGEIAIRSKDGKLSDEKWVEVAKLLGLSDDQRSNLDLLVQVLKETRRSDELHEFKIVDNKTKPPRPIGSGGSTFSLLDQ